MLFLKEYADLKLRPTLNKDLHNFQGSLGRFSDRISRVMKRADLERVLEQEIYQVLPVKKVAFITVDTSRLQELKLAEPLGDIRESLIAAVQSATGKTAIGTILVLDRGIGVVAGKKLNLLHILWLDDKGSQTKYNLDELAWLRTLANYSAIVYENLYLVESLVEELEAEFRKKNGNASSPWLSRLIFTLSEKERRKLASDLHDSALQDQLIWYRNLESAMLDHEMEPQLHQKLDNIKEGLLDVIHQIRETCNELRPPLLQEMGIVEALRGLFEQAQIRSDYVVDFLPGTLTADINDDQLLTIYRIVQELLRNASKHARASTITITLEQGSYQDILLSYRDNGIGLRMEELQDSYHHMGLSGIKERVHSLEGEITFKSEPGQGLEVQLVLPLDSGRLGTKTMIEQDPDMQVTVLISAMEALELIEQEEFDVLLFDLNMPVINGIELTKRIMRTRPDSRILIYTGYEISPNFNVLVEAGVSGVVSKTSSREQLLNAIRCSLREEAVIPVSLLRQLRRRDIRLNQGKEEKLMEEVSINEREQEILQEVSSGSSNRDIATKLLMSQRTVEYNLTRIFEKLNVRSRSEAIVEARRLGLIRTDEFN
ncbi:hypothetical protein KC345_g3377 [Hortaea werneckii]|nr:hypothetical protein KC345_g3377 [Hortaea werneckii]